MTAPLVSITTANSPPVRLGSQEVVLISLAVQLRLPFARLLWNRPLAVSIRQPGRQPRRLPVVDVTRRAQLAVWAGGLAVWLLVVAAGRRRQRAEDTKEKR